MSVLWSTEDFFFFVEIGIKTELPNSLAKVIE